MYILATTFHDLCFFSNDFPRLFTTYARCRSLSAEGRASVRAASPRLSGTSGVTFGPSPRLMVSSVNPLQKKKRNASFRETFRLYLKS